MRGSFHPDFPKEIKKFQAQYRKVSERLGLRFRLEVDKSIERIKASPGSAGHLLNTDSQIVKEVRRRYLSSFPFFILYGVSEETIVLRSLVASASDPLTWLTDFPSQSTGR